MSTETSPSTTITSKPDASQPGGIWMVMLDGTLLILLGVFLAIPDTTVHDMLVRGFGLLLCAAAVAVGVKMWTSSTSKQFGPVAWLACIVLFMIGGILLIWPNESLEAIAITVGIVILIRGIIETSVGLADRRRRGWKFLLTRGLITIALGIFFLWFPNWAAYLLLILIGIDFIARGVSGVSRARQLQKQQG